MKRLKILLVSGEKVFWEGLVKILERRSDIEIVGKCFNGNEAIRKASETNPDVVLIDEGITDCGAIVVSQNIRRLFPMTLIGIITTVCSSDNRSILRAEAEFYLDKDMTTSRMNMMIDRWHEDVHFDEIGILISPVVAEMLVKKWEISKPGEHGDLKDNTFGLTKREMEILNLVAEGKVNKEIASALFITENTVKAHLGSIYEKLHVRTRHQVAALAEEKGIFSKIGK